MSSPVQVQKNPIDRRPFQSKAERDHQQFLEAQYHNVAIPELAAALCKPKDNEPTPAR